LSLENAPKKKKKKDNNDSIVADESVGKYIKYLNYFV